MTTDPNRSETSGEACTTSGSPRLTLGIQQFVLALLLFLMIMGCIGLLAFVPIQDKSGEILYLIVSQLVIVFVFVGKYYWSSTGSSDAKNETIAQLTAKVPNQQDRNA